jgi:hypothetical protein
MPIPAEQVDPFTLKFGGKPAKRIKSKTRRRTVKTTPPSTGPPLAETLMSDGVSPNSDAWMQRLRDYLRAPTPMSTIVLLTPRETAKHLRCTERTLERHRLIGDGPPFVKIGALVRYPLSELEKWLADRLRLSTSEGTAPPGRRLHRKARTELEPSALK